MSEGRTRKHAHEKKIIFGKNGYPAEVLKEVSFPYENDSVLYIFQQADSFLLVLNVINSCKKLSKVKKVKSYIANPWLQKQPPEVFYKKRCS